MLSPLTNNILFVFIDEIVKGQFVEKSSAGLYLGNHYDHTIKKPRWARVVAMGPDAIADGSVDPTDLILIEPLMWTEGFTYDGVTIWKTNITKVMAVQKAADSTN